MFATSALRDLTKDVRNVCPVCWIQLIDKSKITKSRFRGQMHLQVRCKEFVDEPCVSHNSNFHPKSVRQNAMKSKVESMQKGDKEKVKKVSPTWKECNLRT